MTNGWARFLTLLSILSAKASGQSINAFTIILSVCNMGATITPRELDIVYRGHKTPKTPYSLNVNDLFKTCSHNRANFSSDIMPSTVYVPCIGYLQPTCDVDGWASYADSFVQGIGVNLSKYSHRIYILPRNDPCGWGGLGTVGPCEHVCRVWVSGKVADKVAVYTHELAHNLGLGHAGYLGDSYGDLSDMQGYCCKMRCWGAPHSDLLNWTTPLKTFAPPESDIVEYVLKPNEYVRMRDRARLEDVWVQYRVGKPPYDNVATKGIYISSTQVPYYTSSLQVVLTSPGGSYDYFNTMRVVVKSLDKSGAVVVVRRVSTSATYMDPERLPL